MTSSKNKIKKLSLTLSMGIILTPSILGTISCGKLEIEKFKILPTYTSHADMLIALGITPDYYPVQLNTGDKAYDYITNPAKHISNNQSEQFKQQISNEIKRQYGLVKKTGRSWWNQNAEKADNTNPAPEYWTKKYGDIVFYEHYLLDDDKKVIDSKEAPGYYATIEANFRAAQDPYTRVSKETIADFSNRNTTNNLAIEFQKAFGLRNSKSEIVSNMWNSDVPIINDKAWNTESEYFDDAYFAYTWNFKYLNSSVFAGSIFETFVKNADGGATENIFHVDNTIDLILTELFNKATLDGELEFLKEINYLKLKKNPSTNLYHHPIYDAQTEVGEAPMFEGSRRDPMIYLYQLASSISNLVNGKDEMGNELSSTEIKDHYANVFMGDSRLEKMQNALENAVLIANDFSSRLNRIKDFIQDKGLAGKSFGIVTLEPGGGIATIQTNSKYDFILDRIGLKYPLPVNFNEVYKTGEIADEHVTDDSMYTMDDNSWFWNLGSQSGLTNDYPHITNFAGTADFGVITARDINWNNTKPNNKTKFENIFKSINDKHSYSKVDYDIWNEGLKAPSALNMIVDQMVDSLLNYIGELGIEVSSVEKDKIYNWGTYWTNSFGK